MKSKLLLAAMVAVNIINCMLLVILICVAYRTYKYNQRINHEKVVEQVEQIETNDNEASVTNTPDNTQVQQQTAIMLNNIQYNNIPVEEEIIPEEVEPVTPELVELVSDITDVTVASNATPEELNLAIQESCPWMFEYNPNMGQVYYNLEQEHGINAYFALAVSFNEVGVRKMSNLAKNNNNTYGLMNGVKYESIEDCTDYFFRLIKKHYVGKGLSSVEDISKKYCPGDDNKSWIDTVSFYMEELPNRSR